MTYVPKTSNVHESRRDIVFSYKFSYFCFPQHSCNQVLLLYLHKACNQVLLLYLHKACNQVLLLYLHKACNQVLLLYLHRACNQVLLLYLHKACNQVLLLYLQKTCNQALLLYLHRACNQVLALYLHRACNQVLLLLPLASNTSISSTLLLPLPLPPLAPLFLGPLTSLVTMADSFRLPWGCCGQLVSLISRQPSLVDLNSRKKSSSSDPDEHDDSCSVVDRICRFSLKVEVRLLARVMARAPPPLLLAVERLCLWELSDPEVVSWLEHAPPAPAPAWAGAGHSSMSGSRRLADCGDTKQTNIKPCR